MFSTFLLLLSNIFESTYSSKIYSICKTSFYKKREYVHRGLFPSRMPLCTLFSASGEMEASPFSYSEHLRTLSRHCLDFVLLEEDHSENLSLYTRMAIAAKKKRITFSILNSLIQYMKTDKIKNIKNSLAVCATYHYKCNQKEYKL